MAYIALFRPKRDKSSRICMRILRIGIGLPSATIIALTPESFSQPEYLHNMRSSR
jgi:hypothetical protein